VNEAGEADFAGAAWRVALVAGKTAKDGDESFRATIWFGPTDRL